MVAHTETPLILPPGYKKGLIIPKSKPGDNCPFAKSVVKVIPRADRIQLAQDPNRIKLSLVIWWLFNQRSHGSCAAEAKNGVFQITRELENQQSIKFNPYPMYGVTGGGRDQGSSLEANLTFGRNQGHFPMDLWGREHGIYKSPPRNIWEVAANYKTDEFYQLQTLDEFKTCLLCGVPIYWGYRGHAIVGVEYIDEDFFWYHNSWGSWGTKPHPEVRVVGFGKARYSSIYWGYRCYIETSTTFTRALNQMNALRMAV